MVQPQMNLSISKSGGSCMVDTRFSTVLGSNFNLDKRYEITKPLGTGVCGVVC